MGTRVTRFYSPAWLCMVHPLHVGKTELGERGMQSFLGAAVQAAIGPPAASALRVPGRRSNGVSQAGNLSWVGKANVREDRWA